MRLTLVSICLALLTSCGSDSASCSDTFSVDLPDLLRIGAPASTTITAGETIDLDATVDGATRYVSLQLRSVESDASVGTGSSASGTTDPETVTVALSVDDDAPAGMYYVAADVCAAANCSQDEPRTSYRHGSDNNFLEKMRIEGMDMLEFTSCVVIYRLTIE